MQVDVEKVEVKLAKLTTSRRGSRSNYWNAVYPQTSAEGKKSCTKF
jgi:hypothetical protein